MKKLAISLLTILCVSALLATTLVMGSLAGATGSDEGVVYRAKDYLDQARDNGAYGTSPWRAQFTNANQVSGTFLDMTGFFAGSISSTDTDGGIPCVKFPVTGMRVISNQHAGGGWWDKAALTYTAAENQSVRLSAAEYTLISNYVEGDWATLVDTEGRVAIFHNDTKIWPTDKDEIIVNSTTSVEFPTLDLDLAAGDVVRIVVCAATPGASIDTAHYHWENDVLMDPQIEVLPAVTTTTEKTATNLPEGAVVYNAKTYLDQARAAGAYGTSPWRAQFTNANQASDTFLDMVGFFPSSISSTDTDGGIPCVQFPATGMRVNSNQWAGGGWWDKAALTYTAADAQSVLLTAGEYDLISNYAVEGYATLTTTEGRVAIFHNNTKIWPTDKDEVIVNSTTSVEFPTLELDLAAGDVVRIVVYGAAPGASIDTQHDSYSNDVVMDPQIVVLPAAEETTTTTEETTTTTEETTTTTEETTTTTEETTTTTEETTTTTEESTTIVTTTTTVASDVLYSSSAKDEINAAIVAGTWKDSNWKAEYVNVNLPSYEPMMKFFVEESGLGNMVVSESVYAQLPYLAISKNGVVLNANQWAYQNPEWWDMAAVAYTAPETQNVRLCADQYLKISNYSSELGDGMDAASLTATEGRVAIYKNKTKLWPKDADYAIVNSETAVDFPTLEVSLNKGDVIRIVAFGAAPGKPIGWDTGSNHMNHILMDPKVEVLKTEVTTTTTEEIVTTTTVNDVTTTTTEEDGGNVETGENTRALIATMIIMLASGAAVCGVFFTKKKSYN